MEDIKIGSILTAVSVNLISGVLKLGRRFPMQDSKLSMMNNERLIANLTKKSSFFILHSIYDFSSNPKITCNKTTVVGISNST